MKDSDEILYEKGISLKYGGKVWECKFIFSVIYVYCDVIENCFFLNLMNRWNT